MPVSIVEPHTVIPIPSSYIPIVGVLKHIYIPKPMGISAKTIPQIKIAIYANEQAIAESKRIGKRDKTTAYKAI